MSIPASFSRFPGAVLQLSGTGTVLDSNGVLDRAAERPLVGRAFGDLLDPDSSADKWRRILALPRTGAVEAGAAWELVFSGKTTLEERTFTFLWDPDADSFWAFEHPRDARMAMLRDEVGEINAELANTQRELLKERARLAATLEALERQYAEVERLATTVQRQNAELERSNQALDEFAHVVSHDLQAPLRGIANHAGWAAEELDGGADRAELHRHLGRIEDRVARMTTMIQGVLEYARAGRRTAEAEEVDVRALVDDVVDLLAPRNARIEIVEPLGTLVTERAPLQQVLLNLIGNALRYGRTEPDGEAEITVTGRDSGDFFEYHVTDRGPGIPATAQERIWTLFHTLEPEDRARGSGIGLALVRKLVTAHGGSIEVESDVGSGATFRFRWPKAPPPRRGEPTP